MQAADATRQIAGLEERIAAEVRELSRRARGRCSAGPPGVAYLFIGGCPRSGTTAITTLLNGDDRILLGQERFRRIRKVLEPFHFTEEIFFNPTARETSWATLSRRERVHPGTFAEYHAIRDRWRRGTVQVLGDKVPYYSEQLERLGSVFDEAKFVILVRDLHEVAGSYRRRAADPDDRWPAENDHRLAISDWNDALRHARAFAQGNEGRLLVVSHARFFFGERAASSTGCTRSSAWTCRTTVRDDHASMVRDAQPRRARAQPLPPPVAAAVDAGRDGELDAWASRAAIS